MEKKTPTKKREWKFPWTGLLAVLIGLGGLGVFMYPSTAQWWSQYHESKAVTNYQEQVAQDPPPGNAVQLERAHEYNNQLEAGNVLVGTTSNKPVLEGGEQENGTLNYWDVLPSDTGVMARLKIPSIDLDLPVYHGTSDETLEKGVGHLEGTALPVGGEGMRSALTAHTGLAKAELFDNLKDVELGDTFTVSVAGEVLTYRVIETQTILPEETEAIIPREGEDLVTLITCTPLGINTHRYLVTGERIFPTPIADVEAAQREPEVPRFPWWAVILLSGVVGAVGYMWWAGYPAKPKPTKQK